jgi:hypothetical protein
MRRPAWAGWIANSKTQDDRAEGMKRSSRDASTLTRRQISKDAANPGSALADAHRIARPKGQIESFPADRI